MSAPDIRFTLPVPPSTNNLYVARRDGKGRAKAGAYKAWIEEAGKLMLAQRVPRDGLKHVRVEVEVPFNYQRDIDNALKPILDIAKRMHVIVEDRWVDQIEVRRVPVGQDLTVSIWRL